MILWDGCNGLWFLMEFLVRENTDSDLIGGEIVFYYWVGIFYKIIQFYSYLIYNYTCLVGVIGLLIERANYF